MILSCLGCEGTLESSLVRPINKVAPDWNSWKGCLIDKGMKCLFSLCVQGGWLTKIYGTTSTCASPRARWTTITNRSSETTSTSAPSPVSPLCTASICPPSSSIPSVIGFLCLSIFFPLLCYQSLRCHIFHFTHTHFLFLTVYGSISLNRLASELLA